MRVRAMSVASVLLSLALARVAPAAAARTGEEFEAAPTLAAVYFDNVTGVDHLAWLPMGFLDLLIRDFEAAQVKIIGRATVDETIETYKEAKASPFLNKIFALRLGKVLDASHLVTGRFVRQGSDLVVEIKLYDVKLNKQIGWRQIRGPSDDVVYLLKQTELKIVELMKLRLEDRQLIDLMQISTRSPKAIAYYAMGLEALKRQDRDMARSHLQLSLGADKYFKPALSAISDLAFVLSGKAIMRGAIDDTPVIGASSITSVGELIEIARTNAFDFQLGDPQSSPIQGDTLNASVRLPLKISVRPDYVNLWLYAIRKISQDRIDQDTPLKLSFERNDLFDQPVSLTLPVHVAREWLDAWRSLRMKLTFQRENGDILFETPGISVLPLYIGNAEGQFEGFPGVNWQIQTAYEVERIPKAFFEEPLQVGLEIDR